MNPILFVPLILIGIWLLAGLPRQKARVKRTSKLVILARLSLLPFLFVFGVSMLYSLIGQGWDTFKLLTMVLGAILLFLWAFVNVGTFLISPTNYMLWRRGGGDPWFDSLPPPLNFDDDSTRYAELYQAQLQDDVDREFGPSSIPPDSTKGIDDENLI